jgi:hypothetical protein
MSQSPSNGGVSKESDSLKANLRVERRKAKNILSARKSRERKANATTEMLLENEALRREVRELRKEINRLGKTNGKIFSSFDELGSPETQDLEPFNQFFSTSDAQ